MYADVQKCGFKLNHNKNNIEESTSFLINMKILLPPTFKRAFFYPRKAVILKMSIQ